MNHKQIIITAVLVLQFTYINKTLAECVCVKLNNPRTAINQAIIEMDSRDYKNSLALQLLRSQRDPDITNSCGAGLLLIASIYNDIVLVRELLSHNANPDTQNFEGISPIYFAAQWSSNEVLSMLLEAGGDPNVVLKSCSAEIYNAPILTAALNDNIEGIRILLRHGADYAQETKEGFNIFDMFLSKEMPLDLIVEIISHIPNKSNRDRALSLLLFKTVTSMNNDYLRELLKMGVDPNFVYMDDVKFNTPLLIAAISDNLEAAKLLVENGADIKYKNLKEYSLERIIKEGNVKELSYLFE